MALAVMDDMGGILVIALFYGGQIHYLFLAVAAVLLFAILMMNWMGVKKIGLYVPLGLLLWYCIYRSGVHGTIAGVLFAFCVPRQPGVEKALSTPVGFIVMPLFGLANMAISLNVPVGPSLMTPLSLGIMAGLVLGKPLGIFLFFISGT